MRAFLTVAVLGIVAAVCCGCEDQKTAQAEKQATLAVARDFIAQRKFAAARKTLDGKDFLRDDKDAQALRWEIAQEDERTLPEREAAKKRAAAEAAEESTETASEHEGRTGETRFAYRYVLREEFLDKGFDITVSVSDLGATDLYLTYALFNDVWVRSFRKGGLAKRLHELGFQQVHFSDGDQYDVVVSWPD